MAKQRVAVPTWPQHPPVPQLCWLSNCQPPTNLHSPVGLISSGLCAGGRAAPALWRTELRLKGLTDTPRPAQTLDLHPWRLTLNHSRSSITPTVKAHRCEHTTFIDP